MTTYTLERENGSISYVNADSRMEAVISALHGSIVNDERSPIVSLTNKEEGIKICLEMIERIKSIEGVSGIHLMPIGWESITPVILERAGLLPRPQI